MAPDFGVENNAPKEFINHLIITYFKLSDIIVFIIQNIDLNINVKQKADNYENKKVLYYVLF